MKRINEFKGLISLVSLPSDLSCLFRENNFDYIDIDYSHDFHEIEITIKLNGFSKGSAVVKLKDLTNERVNIMMYAINKFNKEKRKND